MQIKFQDIAIRLGITPLLRNEVSLSLAVACETKALMVSIQTPAAKQRKDRLAFYQISPTIAPNIVALHIRKTAKAIRD